MRKIQTERKLFELFGHKFFVFENFKDEDLNIDDQAIYKNENRDKLIDIFVNNQFYSIWKEERRYNASVICACEGKLDLIVDYLNTIGIPKSYYSSFDCGLERGDKVLFLTSKEAMKTLTHHLAAVSVTKNTSQPIFFTTPAKSLDKSRVC